MIKDNTNTNGSYLSESVLKDGYLNEQGLLNVALSFFGLNRCLYVNTEDTTIVSGKTYYTYTDGEYVAVENPSAQYLSTYYEESQEKEVILFKQYLPIAKMYCCRIFDWSFLLNSKTYEEDDITNSEEYDYDDLPDNTTGIYIERDEDDSSIYYVYNTFKGFRFCFKLPENCIKVKYINDTYDCGYAIKGDYIYTNSKTPVLDYISSEIGEVPLDFAYMIAYRVAIELSQFMDNEAGQKASSMFTVALQGLTTNEEHSTRRQNPSQDYMINPLSSYWAGKGIVPDYFKGK